MKGDRVDRTGVKRARTVRLVVLLTVLAFSTFLGVMHQFSKTWVPAGVDAFCPFGALESAYALVINGVMLQRIAWSSFTLLLAVLLVTLLFRRSFCGNICPLGTLQELFGKIGGKGFGKPLKLVSGVDRPARFLKYAVLVVFLSLTYLLGTLVIRPYDPWVAYQHLLSSDLFAEFAIGAGVLTASLIGSVFINRVFCRYLCPMGGFLGLIHRVGRFRVKRREETCIHCKACDRACPVGIPVESLEEVQTAECINCNECMNACPVKDTLIVSGRRSVRTKPVTVTLVTVLLFIVVVVTAGFMGGFEWRLKTMTEQVEESGKFNPDDILGRNSFREVSEITGIPEKLFLKKFSISKEDFDQPIKDSAHREGSDFDTEDVREFVREQLEKN
jgi:ferredoxin